ncbi:hypothetical protein J7E93_34885 [Streptomyces sp. ISL-36]|uniref:hypothetical protein n=1 Tax=Streptomyces sp. ISL-36 TaxID=2819182 RepID=UPI001BEAA4B7|nr:hypothetical protein [Streptomyces sp. ISL-36]MBT2445180.1 hypothetical protein [Streptomyces sp. ISL-36]
MTTSIEDRPRFAALARLAPEHAAAAAREAWDIGEQEAAITGLVETFLREGTPVTERARGGLAALAETWGVWEALQERIASCRPADEDDTPWRLAGPEPAEAIRGRLVRAIGPGHALHGFEPVVWMACGACDAVLVRVHEREPWGVSPFASHYAVVRPTDERPTPEQGPETAPYPAITVCATPYEALDRLDVCR